MSSTCLPESNPGPLVQLGHSTPPISSHLHSHPSSYSNPPRPLCSQAGLLQQAGWPVSGAALKGQGLERRRGWQGNGQALPLVTAGSTASSRPPRLHSDRLLDLYLGRHRQQGDGEQGEREKNRIRACAVTGWGRRELRVP